MVELREQLGSLLRLEVKYATRDYLLDLRSPRESRGLTMTQNEDCDCDDSADPASSSHGQLVPSGGEMSASPTAVNEAADDNAKHKDAALPSKSVSMVQNTNVLTEKNAVCWREKICEWSYQVADHFDLTRDLVYVALNYVDRVCAASDTVALLQDKSRFQLLAMAALCLAIKLHGGMDTHVPGAESSIVETILHLGRGHFTADELKAMEADALQRLQWLLNPPTPQAFVSYLLELFPTEDKTEVKDIAIYVAELAVHDYYLISTRPSVLALAALSNAMAMLGHSDAWLEDVQQDLFRHDGYEEAANIEACKDRLDRLFANTGTKLEDFVDISSHNDNHLDAATQKLSPTSVIN